MRNVHKMYKPGIRYLLEIKNTMAGCLRGATSLPGIQVYMCISFVLIAQLCRASESVPDLAGTSESRPNILLIIADDLGYSDIGAFGSEIRTPRIDELARNGTSFTNFHVHSNCSPTRSMLFSGVDSHRAGLGTMQGYQTENQAGKRGYEGYLNADVVSFASLLKEANYSTFMTGKWHLGLAGDLLPGKRGFENTYILGEGSADHFDPKQGTLSIIPEPNYRSNGKKVLPTAEGFYSTKFFTDQMIAMLERRQKRDNPFLAVVSYTAPHWPLQAPEDFIDNYDGAYNDGYEAVRADRLAKQKRLGIVPGNVIEAAQSPVWRRWNNLHSDQRLAEIRRMQTYAGMIEAMDHHLGRLLDYLKQSGDFDNTVVIFMSDNGPEGNNPIDLRDNPVWVPANFDLSVENIGKPGSYSYYGPGWAHVSATPFRLYKAFPTEGGIRVPGIISYPAGFRSGVISSAFISVLDIVPTILEIAKVDYPKTLNDIELPLLDGASMVRHLKGLTDHVHEKAYAMGWELWDRKALIQGDWKIVGIDNPWGEGETTWMLYDLSSDPGEMVNLATKMPGKLVQMKSLWDHYAKTNGVIKPNGLSLKFSNTLNYYQ